MAILNNSNAISSGGYDINNSLRFRSSATAYLNRTPASTGNRQTFTYSFWIKRGTLGTLQRFIAASDNATGDFIIAWTTSDTLEIYDNGPATVSLVTTQVFRDPSAWYHIVVAYDTTQATSTNRVKVYVNGSQVTAFGTAVYPTQNTNSYNNQASIPARIGIWPSGSQYLDGYLTEFNFINAQALTPSSFGETDTTTGSWKPKAYTGTYGTNGFYLKFSDIATTSGSNAGLGKDFSGNANYWTTNNISVTAGTTYDAMIDSPTLTSATVANYAVMNAAAPYGSSLTLSQANLKITCAGAYWAALPATFGVSSGKWYWEVQITNLVNNAMIGITKETDTGLTTGQNVYPGISANSYGYIGGGQKYNNATGVAYGATYTTNDIIGVALDMDAGTLTFYKNNTSQGTAFSSLSGTYLPSIGVNDTNTAVTANFGQRPFSYTPPTGYKALNTYNLPDSTIKKGNTVMDATLYTGTGATQSITNAGSFKPDLVWTKSRSSGALFNNLNDSVRGATRTIFSNSTQVEDTTTPIFSAFNTNGFAVGSDVSANSNGATFVGWQWQAGQGTTSSNTSGTITSTVSVNASAGFSIVTFTANGVTGATVGHGLGVAPKMMIVKCRSNTQSWPVYHTTLGNTKYLMLNTNAAEVANIGMWNNTSPTSTVFTTGDSGFLWGSGFTYVVYCWAEIAGFSKFGSYTGNGSTDGPFIFTGFRPKFIMRKQITDNGDVGGWIMFDNSRDTYNVETRRLLANSSNAEATPGNNIDVLSNGWKERNSDGYSNASGQTYIYMAFAENPFKNSLAR
jgi:hypothetical protein